MNHTLTEQLIVVLFLVVGLMMTPLLFIGLDFWAGIRKAHARGDRIRSDKMQRTIQKLSRYYNAILAMLVLDCVQISGFVFLHIYNSWTLYTFPLFTLLAVVLIVWLLYKAKVFSSAKLWPPVSGAQKPAREDGI